MKNKQAILYILTGCSAFILLQFSYSDGLSIIKLFSLFKIAVCLLFYSVIKDCRLQLAVKRSIRVFTFSYCIVMLYPWLPNSIKGINIINQNNYRLDFVNAFEWMFFMVWGLYALGLYIFCKFNQK